jgi:hypothetical protein
MKEIINQLASIEETIAEEDLVEQILNFLPKNMESLSTILIYIFNLFYLNGLIKILLHDEAKEELKGKKIENGTFLIKSKFNKAKLHQYDKNTCKGLTTKHEGNWKFCQNPNYEMQNCVELSNKINIAMLNVNA